MAISLRDLDGDADLVDAAQAGDREAFAELFRRHYPSVRRSCMRHLHNSRDADEVTQAAFVRAWERLDRCRGERRFGGWVQTIAHNLCVDSLRKRARLTLVDSVDDTSAPSVGEPEHALLRRHEADVVHRALADLPPRQRDVVIARDLEQRRPGEIAAALGLTVGAVDSLLLRGRRRLAAAVSNLDEQGAVTTSSATSVAAAGASTSGRFLALVESMQDAVLRASYHVAHVLGVVPGVASPLQRASEAAMVAGAISSGGLAAGGPMPATPAVAVPIPPAVTVTTPAIAAPAPVAAPAPPVAPAIAPQPVVPVAQDSLPAETDQPLVDALTRVTGVVDRATDLLGVNR